MNNPLDLKTYDAYNRLLDVAGAIISHETFYKAAKDFVDAYEKRDSTAETSDERPKINDVYRDVFGCRWQVTATHRGIRIEEVDIVRLDSDSPSFISMPLENFLHPKFIKVD